MIVRRPLSPLLSLRSEIARALRRSAVAVRLFGCLALVSVSTQAAELQLRNGDRLTGEIIRRADGRIHLSSMIFGNVVIAESDVVFVSDPKNPMDPSFGSPSSSAVSASAPSHAGSLMPATGTKSRITAHSLRGERAARGASSRRQLLEGVEDLQPGPAEVLVVARMAQQEEPHAPHQLGVVREVEELVAFEKRWLTDALVNSDARGVYEVSFRAISKLQILVAASDPDDTFAKVICLY
jgi:hypothetical protein